MPMENVGSQARRAISRNNPEPSPRRRPPPRFSPFSGDRRRREWSIKPTYELRRISMKGAMTLVGMLFVMTAMPSMQAGDNPSKEGKSSLIYDFTLKNIDGKDVKLNQYQGKALLLVNVASQCGYTPQYEGLQKVYSKY